METIYLDNNATTAMLPEVVERMSAALAAGFANPASQHSAGRRARRVLEEARETIGRILGAEVDRFDADQVVLTSGGTEANHLAIRGLARAFSRANLGGQPGRVVISAIEHPSVVGAAEQLASEGWAVDRLAVDGNGVVRLEELRDMLRHDTAVVSVMLANNETGVLQPVREVEGIVSEFKSKFPQNAPFVHADGTQAVGKVPVNSREFRVSALTCAAHKVHGPRGVGAVVLRSGVPLEPLLPGGFQQMGLRPGTEDVALAVGMQAALELWETQGLARTEKLLKLREKLEKTLLAGWPGAVVHGASVPRLPHTTCIALPPLDRQALVMALDLAGVCCSTGTACASGSSEPSPVLLAMGLPEELVSSSIRLSVSVLNTEREVEEAAVRILQVAKNLRPANQGA